MARKKKEKIRVDLELPKDDNTQTVFMAILMVGILIGLLFLGFWILNADLVFKPANGNPMFLNLVCPYDEQTGDGFIADDHTGTNYAQNQSCALTQESARTEVWSEEWDRVQQPGVAKAFEIPGMDPYTLQGTQHPIQPMRVHVDADSDRPIRYSVTIWNERLVVTEFGEYVDLFEIMRISCISNNKGGCSDSIDSVNPSSIDSIKNDDYEFWLELITVTTTGSYVDNTQIGTLLDFKGTFVSENFSIDDMVYTETGDEIGRIKAIPSATQIEFYNSVEISGTPSEKLFLYKYDPRPGSERMLQQFRFTVEVDAYDGVPQNMNNQSLWIGPELVVGPLKLRPTLFVNFFGLGFLVMVYPAALYFDRQVKKIDAIEDKFPDFLRDLAEYWKGGLSMTLAVRTLANSEYGALNDDIKKMSDQLSWGIAFSDVLFMFADRVGTPLVKRAVSLISEANKAGGKISDILVTAANDSREIQFLKGERERAIGSYIAVIWVSFMVFLGVIVVLSKVFIPAIASSGSSGGSDIGNMQINAVDPLFFLVVFFYGVSAQAMGNGAMAGIMATGRLSSGMKHAGMMLIIAILVFNLAAFSPDLIGVPAPQTLSPEIGSRQPGM